MRETRSEAVNTPDILIMVLKRGRIKAKTFSFEKVFACIYLINALTRGAGPAAGIPPPGCHNGKAPAEPVLRVVQDSPGEVGFRSFIHSKLYLARGKDRIFSFR